MTWDDNFELAKSYYEHYGNLQVNYKFKTLNGYDYDEAGYNLGNWIHIQRVAFRYRYIPKEERINNYVPLIDERVEKLKSIGMIFEKIKDYNWNQMYELAKNYYEYYGNLEVSSNFKTLNGYEYDEAGYNLGNWIKTQRQAYRTKIYPNLKRKKSYAPLSDEQVKKLQSIGMIFVSIADYNWNKMYELAKIYYKHYNNLEIKQSFKTLNGYEYDEQGEKLGFWFSNQKSEYKKNNLSKEKIEKLESIGMIFEKIKDYKWEQMYELARNYFNYYGNLEVKQNFKTLDGYNYDTHGENLGNWIVEQRKKYKNMNLPKEERNNSFSPLTKEQLDKLNLIGMIFVSIDEYNWNKMYSLAEIYYNHHNNLYVDKNFKTLNGYEYDENGYKLGNWISVQRISYKNRNLDKDERKSTFAPLTDGQVEKLKRIDMIFENLDDYNWNKMYSLAEIYYNHYGNLRITNKFKTKNGFDYDENGDNLGYWISEQRAAYRNRSISKEKRSSNRTPLTDERVEKLKSIGMVFDLKNNKEKNIELCEQYGLNYKKNNYLINTITTEELTAKINFLLENNIPLIINEQIHEIFFMSNANMKEIYGFTREELIYNYSNKAKIKKK